MVERVLIVALNEDWTGISRLPSGLSRVGFQTFALCPKRSFLAKTQYLQGALLYPTWTYSRSKMIYLWMLCAFLFFRPDLVLPGDEEALLALQNFANLLSGVPYLKFITALVRRSTVDQKWGHLLLSKSAFQGKCREWGLRAPQNVVVKNKEEALVAAAHLGYPVVVKHDAGYGGSGVSIYQSESELIAHFDREKKARGSLLKTLKNKCLNLFFISIFAGQKNISLQKCIEGRVGHAPFCAHNGEVFALNSMVRLETYPGRTGPASVVCHLENKDIENFVRTVAQKLSYSGFGSLEYIVEERTGLLYIIELNPRPTPSCHMGKEVVANDLCEAYYKGLNALPLSSGISRPYTVAMYPGEKRRNPASEYLQTAYHDIPTNDPRLLGAIESNQR